MPKEISVKSNRDCIKIDALKIKSMLSSNTLTFRTGNAPQLTQLVGLQNEVPQLDRLQNEAIPVVVELQNEATQLVELQNDNIQLESLQKTYNIQFEQLQNDNIQLEVLQNDKILSSKDVNHARSILHGQ